MEVWNPVSWAYFVKPHRSTYTHSYRERECVCVNPSLEINHSHSNGPVNNFGSMYFSFLYIFFSIVKLYCCFKSLGKKTIFLF